MPITPTRQTPREREEQAEWRSAEFVISFPNFGDRGRMRGSSYHAPGTLHRPSCRYLTVERRAQAWQPARVHAETIHSWEESVRRCGDYTQFKVCTVCCADMVGKVSTSDGKGTVSRVVAAQVGV